MIDELNRNGLGQSTVVCLGGDPVTGTRHAEALGLFADDPETDAVVLIGEIGGRSELEAADLIATMRKPVIAYIAGRAAPPGKRMGHAGALLGSGDENAPGKNTALKKAGAWIAEDVISIGGLVLEALEASKASA